MNHYSELLSVLGRISKDAGAAVMQIYSGDVTVWEKKDASPLTQADLSSDEIICQALNTHFPEIPILSEESTALANLQPAETFFLVDPLDGTKEFLKRNGEFTINIALIEKGRPLAGVVYAPAFDSLYFAAADFGCWKQEADRDAVRLEILPPEENAPLRVVGSRSHSGDELKRWLDQLPPYEFIPAGSSLKFCTIAEGRADVYPRLGPTMQWDTAAGQCILEQAGGLVVDSLGERMLYGLERPLKNDSFFALSNCGLLPIAYEGLRSEGRHKEER